jgi:antitoxin component of MazEF toxin-antitoxin module
MKESAMIKKLTRHGNSYALVIDKAIMDILGIDPETPLEISTDGRKLFVERARKARRRKKFTDAVAETNEEYGRMLKRLSE